jgi:hypothetical protein
MYPTLGEPHKSVSLLYCVSSVFCFCICFILLLRGPVFLTLFPSQYQNMVSKNPAPLQGGMVGTPHQEGSSSNYYVLICDQMVNLKMRTKNYDILEPSHSTTKETYYS